MQTNSVQTKWYNQRLTALSLGMVSLALTVWLAVRAEGTGSLQQYVLTIVLLIFGINRLVGAARHR